VLYCDFRNRGSAVILGFSRCRATGGSHGDKTGSRYGAARSADEPACRGDGVRLRTLGMSPEKIARVLNDPIRPDRCGR
jgi:hypothetical protein